MQIITGAPRRSSLFFSAAGRRRISDCALISAGRLIRDDAFSGISERFITKKAPRPMDGRCHARFFFFLCVPVSPCVVTYSSDPQFRSANGFLARPEDGENKARVRNGPTEREGKTEFWIIECIERRAGPEERKNLRNIATERVNLHESFSLCCFLLARCVL